LIGKTNRELWEKYGLALAGGVAPAGARTDPRIEGLVGAPSTYRPGLVLYNVFSPKLEGYRPICTLPGQVRKTTPEVRPVDLRRGWNLVTQKVNDEVRSFLVFGGADRPGGTGKKGAYPRDEGPGSKELPKKDAKPEP
jgi:hypothetical protein